jgi:hypothetical protein
MGTDPMKITVVGAILVVAAVIASLLLLLALNENKNDIENKPGGGSQPDQFPQ